MKLAEANKVDMYSAVALTEDRSKYLNFTSNSIYSYGGVIVSRLDEKDVIPEGNSDLSGKNIAIIEGNKLSEIVKKNHPEANYILVDSTSIGLNKVKTKEADLFAVNAATAAYYINHRKFSDLKIYRIIDFTFGLKIALQKKIPKEAISILDKALASIDEQQLNDIFDKWTTVTIQKETDWSFVWKWTGATLGIIFLFVFWNRSLTRRVKERTSTLAESQDRLRLATAAARVAIWDFDPRSNTVFLSPEWKQQLGYEDDELESRIEEWDSRMHPDEREEALGKVEDYLAGRIPEYAMELRLRHKDGSYRWVYTRGKKQLDDAGNPVRILGCHVDITEQKQGKALLEESEERFRATFEQAAVGIAHVAPDGTFLRLNQKFCDIVGYSQEEMQSLSFQKITHPDDLAMDLGYVQEILSGRSSSYSIEKRYVRKDSEIIWVNLTVAAVHMEESEPGWFVSVIEEISDRKQSEERVKQYQQRLKAMALQLTITEEKERRRLAADLHDHVGQSLVFSRIQLAGLKEQTSDEEFIESIDEVSQSLLGIIKDTKDLVFDLSSPLLHELGLSAATSQWLVEHIGEKYGLETECIDNCKTLSLDNEMKALLFRSIRELLANVIKHAFAKKVRVCFDKKNKDNFSRKSW